MRAIEPIRISEVRRAQAKVAVMSRGEVERQLRFSFALVVILTLATGVVVAASHIGSPVNEAAPTYTTMKVS